MALTDESSGGIGTTMLVQPSGNFGNGGGWGYPAVYPAFYGGNSGGNNSGFLGGDWGALIILFLFLSMFGGFGGGYGGMGGFGGGGMFPWLLAGQQGINNNVSDGFRDTQINDNITSVRDGISNLSTQLCQCCGDMRYDMANGLNGVNMNVSNGFANVNTALCNGFNGVNNSIFGAQTALSQQLNANELASLNRSFAEQTANTAGFTAVQSGIADLRYTEATENCATRTAAASNTRDIIQSQTAGTQAILDKLCSLEIDAKNTKIADLERQLVMANLAASQTAQTARLERSNSDVIDGLYNRLATCPVGTMPVYGNQPIFTCPQNVNNGCGCGNGSF